jgi:mannose-1-phosphate guanylyltransferase
MHAVNSHEARHLWSIVLAGGLDEPRLTSRWGRRAPPHQPTASPQALFRQTLERATRLVPPERVVAVLARGHSAYYDTGLGGPPDIQRIIQPAYRGSAAETFLAVLKIAGADPEASVALFPGGQVIEGEARFMSCVTKAAGAVRARPELPIVLGVAPLGPDATCAWIDPGPPIEGLESYAVRAVRRFMPRPSPAEAAALWEGDGLINTRVIIGKARSLIALGARYLPEVLETFEPLGAAFGTPEEALLCEAVYEQMPYASITRALFVRAGDVGVLPISQVRMRLDAAPAAQALAS